MIEKFKEAAAVMTVFAFGAAVGGATVHTYRTADRAEAIAQQAAAVNEAIKKDLNEKVFPQIQKELTELRSAKK